MVPSGAVKRGEAADGPRSHPRVPPETVYLATDRATVLQRIAARAAQGGDDFKLSTELAAAYFDHFEVPTAAEGPLTIMK